MERTDSHFGEQLEELSKRILRGEFEEGDRVLADVAESPDEVGLEFEKMGPEPIPVELPLPTDKAVEVSG